jgi:hypothetical protein
MDMVQEEFTVEYDGKAPSLESSEAAVDAHDNVSLFIVLY